MFWVRNMIVFFFVNSILTSEEEREEEIETKEEVSDGIRNKKLHTVTYASMLCNQMRGCWKIVNSENQIIASEEIFNKKQGLNSPKSAEVEIILDMTEHVKDSTEPHLEVELIVINDNALLHNNINENERKQDNA